MGHGRVVENADADGNGKTDGTGTTGLRGLGTLGGSRSAVPDNLAGRAQIACISSGLRSKAPLMGGRGFLTTAPLLVAMECYGQQEVALPNQQAAAGDRSQDTKVSLAWHGTSF